MVGHCDAAYKKDGSAWATVLKLFFHQPESKIQNEHPWPAPWLSKETGNSAFYLVNALQFLDEPGEWYLDVVTSEKFITGHAVMKIY